jgi:hypothetical protein
MALTKIASNFDRGEWVVTSPGSTAGCQDYTLGEGKLRFTCFPSHLSYNDPIVYPNRPGRAHLHHFFGNTMTDHRSTYRSIRTTGEGTCAGGPVNRTGYWFPAVIKPASEGFPVAKVVNPALIEMYYSVSPIYHVEDTISLDANPIYAPTTFALQHFPNGLEFVWGWPDDGDLLPQGVFGREDIAGQTGLPSVYRDNSYGTFAELAANSDNDNLSDPEGYRDNIIIRTGSPSCWDGVNLTSSGGRSHMAYAVYNSFSQVVCPATHPYLLPHLTVIIWFSHNGPSDFGTWYLSSDAHHGELEYDGGHTFHTDWKGGWDNFIQDAYGVSILGIGQEPEDVHLSSGGILCYDDQRLSNAHLNPDGLPENGWGSKHRSEATRYLDIPEEPPHRNYTSATFSA